MDPILHEQYEYARRRVKQKKALYYHFVVMVLSVAFLFAINKLLNVGEPQNWFEWVGLAWLFVFALHFVRVFVTDSFMNKNWERTQIDKLVAKQQRKMEQINADYNADQNPTV